MRTEIEDPQPNESTRKRTREPDVLDGGGAAGATAVHSGMENLSSGGGSTDETPESQANGCEQDSSYEAGEGTGVHDCGIVTEPPYKRQKTRGASKANEIGAEEPPPDSTAVVTQHSGETRSPSQAVSSGSSNATTSASSHVASSSEPDKGAGGSSAEHRHASTITYHWEVEIKAEELDPSLFASTPSPSPTGSRAPSPPDPCCSKLLSSQNGIISAPQLVAASTPRTPVQQPTPPTTPPKALTLFRIALPPSPVSLPPSPRPERSSVPWPEEVQDFATYTQAKTCTQDLIDHYLRAVESEATLLESMLPLMNQ
ncbi:hypothetical protein C8R44DRAFT_867400 [Mycena epipterygia]|nr:hypothetical protein C8R44DRAFT_867400 [Mycena epipterygia]